MLVFVQCQIKIQIKLQKHSRIRLAMFQKNSVPISIRTLVRYTYSRLRTKITRILNYDKLRIRYLIFNINYMTREQTTEDAKNLIVFV